MVAAALAAVWIACGWIAVAESPATAPAKAGAQRYVVVLEESAGQPKRVAERHSERFGAKVKRVFTKALDGYSARLTAVQAKAIAREPGVAAVGLDPVGELAAQSMPLGARRVFAADGDCSPGDNADVNQNLDIDCLDDVRVDVDVAMLDTPIDPATPDLNVVSNVNCFDSGGTGCEPGTGPNESPECFEVHGALVADLIAGLDNGTGSVGVAAGARIWSVAVADKDVRSPSHCQWDPQPFYMSDVIAGVEWVTDHADDIEVANMSMRFPLPQDSAGEALGVALEEAIDDSIDAGVVYVVAAGNEAAPATQSIPAKYPRVITATAIYDSNGLSGAGGTSGDTCHWPTGPTPTTDHDDTNSNASNYGPAASPNTLNAPGVDIAAPGICTSNAAAHTTAAAAILASTNNPNNATNVQTIRNTLLTTANPNTKTNGGYDDETSPNPEDKEPLLDINNENAFAPATVAGEGTDDILGLDAISLANGTIDVYARGTDNTLRHKTYNDGWTGWERLGGAIASDPGVYKNFDSQIVDLYALGEDDDVVRRWYYSGTQEWSEWGSHGGDMASAPAAVARYQGFSVVNLFVLDNNTTLFHQWYTDAANWMPWGPLRSGPTSGPAVISRAWSEFDLLVRGAAGDLTYASYGDTAGWSSWASLGGPTSGQIASDPAVASRESGELNVFARGNDGAIWHRARTASGWGAWQSLGGVWASNPASVSPTSGQLQVFAVDDEQYLWTNHWTPSGWSGWNLAR